MFWSKVSNKTTIFESVEIETTTFCNRKCNYCPNSKFDRGKHLMDEKLFYKIIDELGKIKFSGNVYPHHYGEPLTDIRIEKFIKYIKDKVPKAKIMLYTNGDFLDMKKVDQLIKNGVDYFQITNHDNKTPENIRKILNTEKIEKYINFTRLDPNKMPLLNRGGLIKTTKKIHFNKCYMVNHLVIDVHGNVTLCCNDFLSSYSFGNLNNSNITEIWNQEYYSKIREEILLGKYSLEICRKCTFSDSFPLPPKKNVHSI